MSVTPLPMMVGCFGISSEAISSVRYVAPMAGTTYTDKLTAAKAKFASSSTWKINTTEMSALNSQANGTTVAPLASPPPHINPIRLSTAQTQALRGSPSKVACPASINSSMAMDNASKLKQETVVLSTYDFTTIADSSTGGGGIPRPYGKFIAGRSGNGNAIWQRMPPEKGTWQSKALPLAITVVDDDSLALVEDLSQPNLEAATLTAAEHMGGRASPFTHVCLPLKLPGGAQDISAHALLATHYPAAFMPSSHAATSAPRSSMRATPNSMQPAHLPHHNTYALAHLHSPITRLPSIPPLPGSPTGTGELGQSAPHLQEAVPRSRGSNGLGLDTDDGASSEGWFALPCATFLTSAPNLPASVRVDAGYHSSKAFLRKGLSHRQQSGIYPAEFYERSIAHFNRKPGMGHGAATSLQQEQSSDSAADQYTGGMRDEADSTTYVGVYVPRDARHGMAADRAHAEASLRSALRANSIQDRGAGSPGVPTHSQTVELLSALAGSRPTTPGRLVSHAATGGSSARDASTAFGRHGGPRSSQEHAGPGGKDAAGGRPVSRASVTTRPVSSSAAGLTGLAGDRSNTGSPRIASAVLADGQQHASPRSPSRASVSAADTSVGVQHTTHTLQGPHAAASSRTNPAVGSGTGAMPIHDPIQMVAPRMTVLPTERALPRRHIPPGW